MKLKYNLLCLFAILVASCVKDKPTPVNQSEVNLSGGHKVYITNEGNYGSNNASVSLYDISNNSVIADIYKTQNNNTNLGDVCQSINKINNKFYIIVNNSSKINIVSSEEFKLQSTITGLTSPRYILPVSPNKAYVSDLYANAISIIDLNTNAKTGSISCSGWTEQMVSLYNNTFITNLKSNSLYVINNSNDIITDSVLVGENAGSIVLDKNSKLWVLSSGSSTTNTPGKLSRINPITLQVELSLSFNLGDSPTNLCINHTKDALYFLNTHIFTIGISDTNLPSGNLISGTGHTFYGLAVNPIDGDIYASDALDYIQKSSIIVYLPNGQQKTTFKTGINASGFYFD